MSLDAICSVLHGLNHRVTITLSKIFCGYLEDTSVLSRLDMFHDVVIYKSTFYFLSFTFLRFMKFLSVYTYLSLCCINLMNYLAFCLDKTETSIVWVL